MEVESHHPHPLQSTHHRKIELQSPQDLTFLQDNLSRAAQDKLDLHFPPSARQKTAQPATFISLDGLHADSSTQPQLQMQPQEDDPLRARVQSLVSSFLARTWSSASHSISINGLDATSVVPQPIQTGPLDAIAQQPQGEREGIDFTYSAYDSRLQSTVASLYSELEALTAQVSKLRREAPQAGAEAYANALKQQISQDEEQYHSELQDGQEDQQRQRQEDQGKDVSKNKSSQPDILKLTQQREGYYEDVQASYTHGVRELSRLAGIATMTSSKNARLSVQPEGRSLTETVGKVQRARTVAMEFD